MNALVHDEALLVGEALAAVGAGEGLLARVLRLVAQELDAGGVGLAAVHAPKRVLRVVVEGLEKGSIGEGKGSRRRRRRTWEEEPVESPSASISPSSSVDGPTPIGPFGGASTI